MTEPGRPPGGLENDCYAAARRFLDRAAELEPTLGAFSSIDPERLLAQARDLDGLSPERRGPLHGLLIAVKEVFDVAGYVSDWGTEIHADRRPQRDADVVASLRAAGALVAGITVSTEYALARVGATTNPYDCERSPGASSQGSAAAVGAGLVPAALGSQTIGSILRPAAYCGCVGFKPTWNTFASRGAMPLSQPIDHVGLIANAPALVRDLAAVLQPAADWRSAELPARLIFLDPWFADPVEPGVAAAIEQLEPRLSGTGAHIERARLPAWIGEREESLIETILAHGMARNHGNDFDRDGARMSERIRDFVLRGRALAQSDFDAALAEREKLAQYLDDFCEGGVFLTVATTGVAPLLRDGTGSRAPQRLWTLAGLPAASVPIGFVDRLPVGLQVIGPRGADRLVLNLANEVFESTAKARSGMLS